MKTLHFSIIVFLLVLTVYCTSTVFAQEETKLPPPSPPAAKYPALKNILSVFHIHPSTVHPNEIDAAQIEVQNNGNFTLYDIQVDFWNDARLALHRPDKIDILQPHETKIIRGALSTSNITSGTTDIFWQIIAKNKTGTIMESTLFQRPLAVEDISKSQEFNYCCRDSDLVSPLKQIKSGASIEDIKCKDDLKLIIKKSNGSPACVKPETSKILVERGWAKSPTGVSTLENPSVGLYNITTSTQPIILGIPFYINAIVVNYQTTLITYYGGCVSPLSVSFDNIKTYTDSIHCLAISKYTLGPKESVPVHSDKIETINNATGPNATTAAIKFSYEIDGKQASIFTSTQLPIQSAIKLDCAKPVDTQIVEIDKSVNVQKAIALAYTSPAFVAKVKQYGNVSYYSFYNDWFPDNYSCNTYWKGVEVMFAAIDKTGSRNIQVSEDINLTKVLNVTDFQVSFSSK